MSEHAFLLGLLASTALMFLAGATQARRRRPVAPLPLTLALGSVRSSRAIGATMAAFVLSFAALAAVAVGAHYGIGDDGPLWVAFALPWVVPLMFWGGRWGQRSGADGHLTLDAHAVTLRWGTGCRRVSRAGARVVEQVVEHPLHGAVAWALAMDGPGGGLAVVWPSQGFLGERFCAARLAAGAQPTPSPPIGAAPLLADLHEVRSLIAHLAPPARSQPR